MNRHRAAIVGSVLALVGWICAGCGGIQGSHSVSPASFFLPGLMHYEVQERQRPDDAAPPAGDVDQTPAKPVTS